MLLSAASLYGAAVRARNRAFDSGKREIVRVPVRVVSVGNLTTGGTGKTPLVAMLAGAAWKLGRRPAILTRGYARGGTAGQQSDEVSMYRRLVPDVPVVVDKDRVRGARVAVDAGADLLLLDDGFQHRRLFRDVDLVLVDAKDPFGGGRLLPAGALREPVAALARASAVIVTRADRAPADALARLTADLAKLCPGVPVLREQHAPVGVLDAHGESLGSALRVAGQRALVVTGIGDPAALAETLEMLGALPLKVLDFGDHHQFTSAELQSVAAEAERMSAHVVVTTEKDLMRIREWGGRVPLRALRIAAELPVDAEREKLGELLGYRL